MATKKLNSLTDEQVKDFTALAEALETQAGVKEVKDDVAGKYKEWLDTWEAQLREMHRRTKFGGNLAEGHP